MKVPKLKMPELGFDTFHRAMKDSLKKPPVGVTQGGSSRKHPGARSAAKDADVQQRKEN